MKPGPSSHLERLKVLIRANAFIRDLSRFWDYGATSEEADTLKPGHYLQDFCPSETVIPQIILDHMSSNYFI